MQMNFGIAPEQEQNTIIKVVGVGGGGGNAINHMVLSGMKNVEFISLNTDYQALNMSHASYKLNIGARKTKGQGAGGKAEVGQASAEESREEIEALLKGADMVFIAAGMGGGTGTGAAPVVAEIAHGMGMLTVGVVTKPFAFERRRRMEQAEMGIASLREHVDALIIIPNERLHSVSKEKITMENAFLAADEVLRQGVQSIVDLICTVGLINLDFADVISVMKDAGDAHMGMGRGTGKDMVQMAAEQAINSPLLETSIAGARGVIINLTIPKDLGLDEVTRASDLISDAAHPDANVIWGICLDDNLEDEMLITVIATGFDRADDFSVSSYIKDIVDYKPKSGAAVGTPTAVATAEPVAPTTAPAVADSKAAPAPAASGTSPLDKFFAVDESPVAEPAAPAVEAPAEKAPADPDPFDVILDFFSKNKR